MSETPEDQLFEEPAAEDDAEPGDASEEGHGRAQEDDDDGGEKGWGVGP
jgi:hypothetical protein